MIGVLIIRSNRLSMRLFLLALIVLLVHGCAVAPPDADYPQPVLGEAREAASLGTRLFYLERMSALAQAIYHSELRRSQVAEAESLDWAISPIDQGGYVVAFIIDLDEGGYVDGEVFFAPGADPDRCLRSGFDPADYTERCDGISVARVVRPASAAELVWASAKRTMLGDPELHLCTADSPAFTLIEEDQRTLGYVLSASSDPDVTVLAGHTRYQLSADGTQILSRLPLFQDCLVVRKQNTASTTAIIVNSLGWDLFNESHVYMTLERRLRVIVAGRLGHQVALDRSGDSVSWRTLR